MSASCTEPEVTALTVSADLLPMRQASESLADRASTFDAIDTTVEPPRLWSIQLGTCIKSTPRRVGRPHRRRH